MGTFPLCVCNSRNTCSPSFTSLLYILYIYYIRTIYINNKLVNEWEHIQVSQEECEILVYMYIYSIFNKYIIKYINT